MRWDYNLEPNLADLMKHKVNNVRFQFIFLIALTVISLAAVFGGPVTATAQAQIPSTPTPLPGTNSAYITQTYTEPINVRTGPSTVDYSAIGQLAVGATAPALGASPKREWIQIAFAAGPGGVGWVYAANVTLIGSLRVVEPPPTPEPPPTGTVDPTMAAAFETAATAIRLPTFTPPPPLSVPTFSPVQVGLHGFPTGTAIIALSFGGVLVLAASLIGRR